MTEAVIAGIGEIADRPAAIAQGHDPIGLMCEAARRACADAGIHPAAIDAVDVVHQISWRYEDTARRFTERLGIAPAHAAYHPGGGESPIRLIHEAALAIASGERRVALVVGGEARNTAAKARRAGLDLQWPPRAKAMEHPWAVEEKLDPLALAHGVAQPTFVYPFYENALVAAGGATPAAEQRRSAELWARFAAVAMDNPYAWLRRGAKPNEIATPSDVNPLIAYPYTRLMVANPTVNQAAAILLMSAAAARAARIAPERLVHVVGGAAASEPDDYLRRDRYDHAPAQDAVLAAARALAPDNFVATEIYSCFPCVPKMAMRTLGLPDSATPTVTGGLTFFGGPFSNYMTHATAAMARRLRERVGVGLLYGQGDFVTKHHALVVASRGGETPPPRAALVADYRVDAAADAARGPIPPIVAAAKGEAVLETFTILHDRAGSPERGVVILRTAEGARTMARVRGDDAATLARLRDPDHSPIGDTGHLDRAPDGLLEWRIA